VLSIVKGMQIFGNQYRLHRFADKCFSNVSINICTLSMVTFSVYRRTNFITFKNKNDGVNRSGISCFREVREWKAKKCKSGVTSHVIIDNVSSGIDYNKRDLTLTFNFCLIQICQQI